MFFSRLIALSFFLFTQQRQIFTMWWSEFLFGNKALHGDALRQMAASRKQWLNGWPVQVAQPLVATVAPARRRLLQMLKKVLQLQFEHELCYSWRLLILSACITILNRWDLLLDVRHIKPSSYLLFSRTHDCRSYCQ